MPSLPISRFQRGPTPQARRATGADFGALQGQAQEQRGQAISQAGQAAGEVADVYGRIREAANQAKLARAAAEYGADLDRAVLDLETDPDLDTHEERIGKTSAELLEKHQRSLPQELHGALQNRVFPSTANAQLEVVRSTNKRRIRDSVANADEMLRLSTDQAARAVDPVRRGQIRGQAVGALDGLKAAGILDQAGYDERVQRLEKGIAEADLLAALESDPAGAYKELGDPASSLAAGRSEAERLKARKDALVAFEHQLSERRANASFTQSQIDRAEKDADDAADQRALDLLAGGDLPGLQQHLAATRGVLSRDRRQYYLDRIASGGGISDPEGGAKTNPDAYLALSARATQGVPIRDELGAALRSNQIDKGDFERLKKQSEDRRFGQIETFLGNALRPGVFDRFSDRKKAEIAEVQRQFSDWAAKNPDADASQAQDVGNKLLQAFGRKEAMLLLRPGDPVGNGGQVDVRSALQALQVKAARGEISEADRVAELARLREIQEAQTLAGAAK